MPLASSPPRSNGCKGWSTSLTVAAELPTVILPLLSQSNLLKAAWQKNVQSIIRFHGVSTGSSMFPIQEMIWLKGKLNCQWLRKAWFVISKLYLETISWIRNRGRSILWVVLIKFAFKCFWTPENHRKVRSANCRIRWSDPPSPKRMALWRILMKTIIHRLSSYWRERTKSPHQQQVVMQRNARGDHRSLWWKHPKDAFLSPFGWEWRMIHTNRP